MKIQKLTKVGRSRWAFMLVFFVPMLLLYTVFFVYPIFDSVGTSFFDWSGFNEKVFIGFNNYKTLLTDPIFRQAIKNDLIITFGKEIMIIILTVFFAVALTRLKLKKWERNFFRFVFYIPNILSTIVIALLWSFVYDPTNMGLLNGFLKLLRLDSLIPKNGWLVELPLPSIIVVASWCGIGVFMIILITAINGISNELYESAQIDGAGRWTELWYITLPEVWGQIRFIVITILFSSLAANFGLILPLTNGGPGNASIVMGLFVYKNGLQSNDPRVGYANAATVILLLISVTLCFIINRLLNRKED